jgi:hypothetical protein
MNPEHSTPLRGLLARTSAVLLGALVLYVAGAGPASYYATRFGNTGGQKGSQRLVDTMHGVYRPLEAGVEKTALKGSLADYRQWWNQRAAQKYPPLLFTFDFYDDPGICYSFDPDR